MNVGVGSRVCIRGSDFWGTIVAKCGEWCDMKWDNRHPFKALPSIHLKRIWHTDDLSSVGTITQP